VRAVLALATLSAASGSGRQDVPLRSRGRLLAELLTVPEDQAARLAVRGRALGLTVDGWHLVLRLEPTALEGTDRYRVLEAVHREALGELRGLAALPGASWNATLADEAVVLLCSQPADPRALGRQALLDQAHGVVERLRTRHPAAGLRGGLGGAHRGPLGIRSSAREARAALHHDRQAVVCAHDAAGLDRMLLEWYHSDAAREAVGELLAPVLALGTERAEPLLRTVQAYLDHNNSPARAAEVLHLHRNAVGARIHRFTELTGADLGDPEQRLALQLACRAGLQP
jgi:sugar diacid utilization regulator